MEISKRLNEIVKDNNLSARQFELSIGKTSGYINMMERRNSYPSLDVIAKIHEKYPEYCLEWLVTGKGNKLEYGCKTEETISKSAEPSSNYVINMSEKLQTELRKIVRSETLVTNSAIEDKLDVIIALLDIKRELKE